MINKEISPLRGMGGPTPWRRRFIASVFRILLICQLIAISDAALPPDFPGPFTCSDDGIQLSKPDSISLRSWKSLHIVDPSGDGVEACDLHPDERTLTIPDACIQYEAGRKIAYISFTKPLKNLVYKIACHDNQADSAGEDPFSDEPVIECGKDFMRANISRTIPDFSDQGVSVPPMATWMVVIYNGTQKTKVNISTARTYGYKLTSDHENFMIQIRYDAFGINKISARNQSLYVGDMDIVMEKLNPKITIAIKLLCATGPFQCNDTSMDIYVPQFDGYLQFIDINNVQIPIPSAKGELRNQSLIVDTSSGTQITFEKGKLKTFQKTVCLPPLTLIFAVDDISVPMRLTGLCSDVCPQPNPISLECSSDGLMTIQVVSRLTRPSLNLDTVILGNGQCQPITKTEQLVVFSFSLTDCGTKMSFVGGVLLYENEVHALWRDKPRRIISRDSEFRETVRCRYNISDVALFAVNVLTPSPLPVSERYDGSISFVLNLYHDDSYAVLYKDNQYPVVKTLQDPIYLEVQVLNRSDPNIELILNDCWATMSPDPNASPQWKIVVDGCAEDQDNYLTVFHPVSNVALPEHRKRFEVKAFAFTVDGDVSTNLVYFHCSALICSIQSPDYALCTKSCPGSRRKRDELFLNRHSMLASLPGPLLFVDSDPAMVLQDESNVIEQITLGVLPAFGIVALVVLAVVLLSHKAKP